MHQVFRGERKSEETFENAQWRKAMKNLKSVTTTRRENTIAEGNRVLFNCPLLVANKIIIIVVIGLIINQNGS